MADEIFANQCSMFMVSLISENVQETHISSYLKKLINFKNAAYVSKVASSLWKLESEEIKLYFNTLADKKKIEHQKLYSDYKYQPKNKLRRRRKLSKSNSKSHLSDEDINNVVNFALSSFPSPNINKSPSPPILPASPLPQLQPYDFFPICSDFISEFNQIQFIPFYDSSLASNSKRLKANFSSSDDTILAIDVLKETALGAKRVQ
ncbi:12773_t:CDS:2 [Dentiscutata erythropus]|uniref:12773_t:CDS:1 n=1 Tax=Dentiscutata erythropus TaxID=1348616 RepID=A0A9N9H0F3_9GLOM|nr:12773_t:CDS:2 [Dentiscutata erythropus]